MVLQKKKNKNSHTTQQCVWDTSNWTWPYHYLKYQRASHLSNGLLTLCTVSSETLRNWIRLSPLCTWRGGLCLGGLYPDIHTLSSSTNRKSCCHIVSLLKDLLAFKKEKKKMKITKEFETTEKRTLTTGFVPSGIQLPPFWTHGCYECCKLFWGPGSLSHVLWYSLPATLWCTL